MTTVGLRAKFWEIVGLDFDDACGGLDLAAPFLAVRPFQGRENGAAGVRCLS